MKLSDVTDKDMKACSDLMNYWRSGEYVIRGSSGREFYEAMTWIQGVAKQMVEDRAAAAAASPVSATPVDGMSNVKIRKAKS